MHNITVYHNPNCGTSRNVLAFIREEGFEPEVIEYLKNPPTPEKLQELLFKMNMTPHALVRVNNNEDNSVVQNLASYYSHEELIKAMCADPILINRPIVVIGNNVKLCRPSESVKEMLSGLS
jgi:arsenate reductase (glutaredoxin)